MSNPKMIKAINSSTIKELLFAHGSLTKPELAKEAKLSLPTVNKIISDLEDKGIVCSVGLTSERFGRKAMLYQINRDSGCIVALYYMRGNYLCRLSDIVGNVLYETTCDFDNAPCEAALASTIKAIDTMLAHARSELKAIGVGIPGAVMSDGKIFAIPKIKGWEGFDLKKELSSRYGVPVHIENDVKLSAVGYYNTYLKDELENFVYIYAGNGMGSGIIINKKLYRGSGDFSGELGFMAPLDGEDAACDYTKEGGYLEKKMDPFIHYYKSKNEKNSKNEDNVLINLFTSIASNYMAIINPAAIVFGGEAFDESLIEEIRKRISLYSPKRSIPQILYDDSEESGINGLVFASMSEIITNVQIVQAGGI